MNRYCLVFIGVIAVQLLSAQEISDTHYLGRSHFRIVTSNAVFLYDCRGGGFSSIKDREDNEWIG
ncbi:unnamed protein product, partial [Chrysoparadoxa australica]